MMYELEGMGFGLVGKSIVLMSNLSREEVELAQQMMFDDPRIGFIYVREKTQQLYHYIRTVYRNRD